MTSDLTLVERSLLATFQQQLHTSILGPTGVQGPPGINGSAAIFRTVGHAGSGATYIGDGVNDQVAINQAITDVNGLGGGLVQMMRSTTDYNLRAAARMKDNVILQGQGRGSRFFLANGSDDNVITNDDHVGGNTNFHVRDIEFEGNGVNQSPNLKDALYFLFSSDFTVQGVYGYNGNRHNCFLSDSCVRGRVLRSRFVNAIGLSNIAAFNGSDHTFAHNITSDATQTGIKLDGCHTCVVNGNVFFNNDTIQIYVTGGSNCTITGNAVRGGQNGVRITSQDYSVVVGNVLRDHSLNGIHMLQDCKFINVTGNLIRDCGGDGAVYSGVFAEDVGVGCKDVLVSCNTIVDTKGHMKYGLQTTGNSDRFQYGGNVVSGFLTAKYALVGAGNSNTY